MAVGQFIYYSLENISKSYRQNALKLQWDFKSFMRFMLFVNNQDCFLMSLLTKLLEYGFLNLLICFSVKEKIYFDIFYKLNSQWRCHSLLSLL